MTDGSKEGNTHQAPAGDGLPRRANDNGGTTPGSFVHVRTTYQQRDPINALETGNLRIIPPEVVTAKKNIVPQKAVVKTLIFL